MQRLAIPALCFILGCSSGQEADQPIPQPVPAESAQTVETPYGDLGQVQGYLNSINPFIQEVGKIHLEVNKAVGTSGQATTANLALAMGKGLPRLKAAIGQFEKIAAPLLLAPLHADIKRLMVLRLNAYEATINNWNIEQQGVLDSGLVVKVENTLREANELIRKLNEQMSQVNLAMEKASSPPQTASP
jgi:hypothetical protein